MISVQNLSKSYGKEGTRVDALRDADLVEIGKAVFDQGQPAAGAIDQIEPAGNR